MRGRVFVEGGPEIPQEIERPTEEDCNLIKSLVCPLNSSPYSFSLTNVLDNFEENIEKVRRQAQSFLSILEKLFKDNPLSQDTDKRLKKIKEELKKEIAKGDGGG